MLNVPHFVFKVEMVGKLPGFQTRNGGQTKGYLPTLPGWCVLWGDNAVRRHELKYILTGPFFTNI